MDGILVTNENAQSLFEKVASKQVETETLGLDSESGCMTREYKFTDGERLSLLFSPYSRWWREFD